MIHIKLLHNKVIPAKFNPQNASFPFNEARQELWNLHKRDKNRESFGFGLEACICTYIYSRFNHERNTLRTQLPPDFPFET